MWQNIVVYHRKSSDTLHSILNPTPTLHQMKKTSDVVFKFLTIRKK